LFPRSAELLTLAPELGALGATISGAGPTVLVWCHYEQTGGVVEALARRTRGWARVMRAPFETQGAHVRLG
jgi:homoserine kinase